MKAGRVFIWRESRSNERITSAYAADATLNATQARQGRFSMDTNRERRDYGCVTSKRGAHLLVMRPTDKLPDILLHVVAGDHPEGIVVDE